jgi:hypothetical protein
MTSESFLIETLAAVNVVFAVGFGLLLARRMGRVCQGSVVLWLVALWGIYMAECVAFSASMGTNVLGFVLAVVWGLVFRRKFRALERREALRSALTVALYTCLPAISFGTVLVFVIVEGGDIWSVQAGYKFGIPPFVPWPANTLAGFFAALIGSALFVKMTITTALAVRRKNDLSWKGD